MENTIRTWTGAKELPIWQTNIETRSLKDIKMKWKQ